MGTERPEDWKRLGRALAARRGALRRSWGRSRSQFAKDVDISYRTISAIERGEKSNYGAALLASIERAYGWAPGSIESVLNGQDPTPLEEQGRTHGQTTATTPRPADYPVDFPDHPALWDIWQDDRLEERDRYVAILSIKGQWDLDERKEQMARQSRGRGGGRAHLG